MMNKRRRILSISMAIIMLVNIVFITSTLGLIEEKNKNIVSSYAYIDITVEEAWEMLNDTSNGIQYPIDVRSDSEWIG